ncbi:protein-methionine-sulfoxide reductase heme-binding subunit MsrQ [Phaeobacter sp. HS012]|uniref:protein-methionine-sulfoxide reductase heme-binding subunit MsrQ n=1 Tax=Phaeobacter TaxID=302485 RepID=UPI001B35B003|nr:MULTISPECIES: protein-methionine-sulfoxide reductase heme-binding subunit MsrQ [Phaeobacter]MBQ4807469.1 protein-methionine-sulfoxide reductase heme-binding subunit MsrQ [Phaeobacter sp. HS012]MBQ4882751.1 protein-methionine-sulfoxide reductase heme-binding subunit MsrQ [Phaeobacter sp. HS011]UWR95846.1 protein-methionine-sulfoxide reductase heme-binding subunit MsrQ [Phaeobacter inhibens]
MQRINSLFRMVPVWLVYMGGMLPAGVLFYQGFSGALGAEPIKALEHEYGELALQLLVATLAITPLRRLLGLNLMRFRRAIGLLCFFYVSCHLLVWLLLDVQLLGQILADILKRPYITIGMAGFVLMLPLALTSNGISVRWLGARWRLLHRLTYPAAFLGALHYVMLAKGFQLEPLIYMGAILLLLALRLPSVAWPKLA